MNFTIPHSQAVALTALLLAATGCANVSPRAEVRVEAVSRGAIRPVNIRVERTRDGAIVRGSVQAGPGYRSWQRHHLVIEVLQSDERVIYCGATTFSPQPIPRIVRSRGRAHFSAPLPQFPPPCSTVRVTPRSGPLPTSTTSFPSP